MSGRGGDRDASLQMPLIGASDGEDDEGSMPPVPPELEPASDAGPRDTDGFEGYVGERAATGAPHKAVVKGTGSGGGGEEVDEERVKPGVLSLLWASIWALKSLSASPNDLESRDYDMYESEVVMRSLQERCLQVRARGVRGVGCGRAVAAAAAAEAAPAA